MQTVDLAIWLRENIDWNKYTTLVKTIGDELNERKLRFDKSDLLERSLELFSNNEMIYVNLEGVDHIGPEASTIENTNVRFFKVPETSTLLNVGIPFGI